MISTESGSGGLYCAHGNFPDTCAICLEASVAKNAIEAKSIEAIEFKVQEVRDQISFLEREDGKDIIESDLSLEQTITNAEKQRTTFVFKLERAKAKQYFDGPTFYEFMNEPFHNPPRFEIERVYCNSEDSNDMAHGETVYRYVNGKWKKV
jgi:hypothetical protein